MTNHPRRNWGISGNISVLPKEESVDAKIEEVIAAAKELLARASKVKSKRVGQRWDYRVSEYSYEKLKAALESVTK